ncbi:hypothetical protein R3P38DRAFT_2774898 [Favolaschia claudopus]|uniref:Uncharacterized protein n=1 Tax=Favolaschia claudopus TaxID=2862362 RepID=A0AAW0BUX4_9AGAR
MYSATAALVASTLSSAPISSRSPFFLACFSTLGFSSATRTSLKLNWPGTQIASPTSSLSIFGKSSSFRMNQVCQALVKALPRSLEHSIRDMSRNTPRLGSSLISTQPHLIEYLTSQGSIQLLLALWALKSAMKLRTQPQRLDLLMDRLEFTIPTHLASIYLSFTMLPPPFYACRMFCRKWVDIKQHHLQRLPKLTRLKHVGVAQFSVDNSTCPVTLTPLAHTAAPFERVVAAIIPIPESDETISYSRGLSRPSTHAVSIDLNSARSMALLNTLRIMTDGVSTSTGVRVKV